MVEPQFVRATVGAADPCQLLTHLWVIVVD
jgi:hypothetical protein